VGFDAGRLRRGELIAGVGATVLLVVLFFVPWLGHGGAGEAHGARIAAASLNGWHSLTYVRWVLLISVAISVALVLFTATRRSPAIPITCSIFTSVLGGLSSLLLIFRLIDPGAGQPGATTAKPGIYFGLLASLLIAYGGYRSMRAESSPFGDTTAVETVAVAPAVPGSAELTGSAAASHTESSSAGQPRRDHEPA